MTCPRCANEDTASSEPLCEAHKEVLMEEKKFTGCGANAERITFRGKGRSRFTCATCPNQSSGKLCPYVVFAEGVETPKGTYSGEPKRCGDEVGGP